jgi:uncharacterized repeat protein (TIGR02543 family)
MIKNYRNALPILSLLSLLSLGACGVQGDISYNLSFDSNGGSPVETMITDGKSEINIPDEPLRNGFTFLGWFFDNNTFQIPLTLTSFIEKPISKNITVFASWSALTFTITFESNGGSFVSPIILNTNQNISFPPNPTKPGNSFGGWYIDNQLETKFTSGRMPPNDLTLYARWLNPYENFYSNLNLEEVDYTWDDDLPYKRHLISFRDDDDVKSESIYFFSDGEIKYIYYYRSGSLSNTGIIYEQTWRHTITTHIDDIKSFRIFMSENRVTKKPNLPQTSITYESEATNGKLTNISSYAATYTFNNSSWNLINHNDDPNEVIKDFYLNLKKVISNVFTFNDFNIFFEVNGGISLPSMTVTKNSPLNLPVPTKTGYSFKGWYTDIELSVKFTLSRMPPYNLILYSKWEINQYTINFDTNGGSLISSIKGNYGDQVIIPDNPVREEGEFMGWFSDETLNEPFTIPQTIPAQNLTIYAKWSMNQYYATFYTNGGDVLPSQLIDFGSIVPTPTKLGHTFTGWFLDEELMMPGPSEMPSENVTLYARWTINQYSISYYSTVIQTESFKDLSAGTLFSLALSTNGEIYSWGDNRDGQLGDGTNTNRRFPNLISIENLQNGESIKNVYAGNKNATALTTHGRVFAWGLNNFGQLGHGTTISSNLPQLVHFSELLSAESINQISLGKDFTVALTNRGRVFAWGLNSKGQLGDGTTINQVIPKLISFNGLATNESIYQVEAGERHSLAVTTNGRVYGWGDNLFYQLGSGDWQGWAIPKIITFSGLKTNESIKNVVAGYHSTSAITTTGEVYMCGYNSEGQLGDGTTYDIRNPKRIVFNSLQTGESIKSVSLNNKQTFAVTNLGRVYGWGSNWTGQVGLGTSTFYEKNPRLIGFNGLQLNESVELISAGYYHTLALTTKGRIYAWGDGELGVDLYHTSSKNRPTPLIDVLGPNTFEYTENYLYVIFDERIVLADPTFEGYKFMGWFKDKKLEQPFDIQVMPANDIILFAYFTKT